MEKSVKQRMDEIIDKYGTNDNRLIFSMELETLVLRAKIEAMDEINGKKTDEVDLTNNADGYDPIKEAEIYDKLK